MFYSNDRQEMRQQFVQAWQKKQNAEALSPVESIIANVVENHPEYHAFLERKDDALDRDFFPEQGQTNPFLHMGLHIALIEQIRTDRPAGIKSVFQSLTALTQDAHEAEHQMMECLAEAMWQAQRDGKIPNEQDYLLCLQHLAKK
jgi:hypothetical protein